MDSVTASPRVSSPASCWFVYILRCANDCLYTGITTDVPKRLAVHNSGKGSAYVRAHRPAELVAFTAAANRSSASKLEHLVKSLPRPQKLALAAKWTAGPDTAKRGKRSRLVAPLMPSLKFAPTLLASGNKKTRHE